MTRFLIRRLLGAIPLLLGVAILSFIFMQLAPGGPDALFARNGRMTEDQLQAIRHNMGLDRPVHEQLLIWLANLARRASWYFVHPIPAGLQVIWDVFPNTLLLMGTGMIISLVAALVFGILAARRPVRLLRQRHLVHQLLRAGHAGLLVRPDAAIALRGPAGLASLGRHASRRTAAVPGICCSI